MTASLQPYCGPPLITAAMMMAPAAGGIPALFEGRRVFYCYKARVAIREAVVILGLMAGDEILAPAYNCGSELDPLLAAGLTVKLYPVDEQAAATAGRIASLIGPRTKAVYLTHYFGFLQPDTLAVRELCNKRGLYLIEDCSLSLLSGEPPAAGFSGDVAIFCFHKFAAVNEGGALVVNNPALDAGNGFTLPPPRSSSLKLMARLALNTVLGGNQSARLLAGLRHLRRRQYASGGRETPNKQRPDIPSHYYFSRVLQGARIGHVVFAVLRRFQVKAAISLRRKNYSQYLSRFDDIAAVKPLFPALSGDACPQSMPVWIRNRDEVAARLQCMGIAATAWWSGYHRGLDFSSQQAACTLKDGILSLPCHDGLTPAAIDKIVDQLCTALQHEDTKRQPTPRRDDTGIC